MPFRGQGSGKYSFFNYLAFPLYKNFNPKWLAILTMLIFDHLVLVAPTLEEGAQYVESQLGVRPFPGGQHRELGTHNLLLRIGQDCFLEVIAVDPSATLHHGSRVFGLGNQASVEADWLAGNRLKTWVGRTTQLETIVGQYGSLVGEIKSVSRGERRWRMTIPADGSLPQGGSIPTSAEYEPAMIPAHHMPDAGCSLQQVIVHAPDGETVRQLYARLGVLGPVTIETGSPASLRALIQTPNGIVELH